MTLWRISFSADTLRGAAEDSRKEKFSWREAQRGNETKFGGDFKDESEAGGKKRIGCRSFGGDLRFFKLL